MTYEQILAAGKAEKLDPFEAYWLLNKRSRELERNARNRWHELEKKGLSADDIFHDEAYITIDNELDKCRELANKLSISPLERNEEFQTTLELLSGELFGLELAKWEVAHEYAAQSEIDSSKENIKFLANELINTLKAIIEETEK